MPAWQALFGHEQPYPQQAEGIELLGAVFEDGGFVALEGACGTGKTMLALTAGLTAVRDERTPFERVFVITSVKQQLRAFEDDLHRIATTLPAGHDPLKAVTLVGKADVCPYHLTGTGGMTDTILYERCENVRERTRDLIDEGRSPGALAKQASDLVNGDGFAVGEVRAPYPADMAKTDAKGQVSEVEYCPFYAQYLEDRPANGDAVEAVPFEYEGDGPLTPEELVELGVEHGTCPHSLMGAVLQDAEVIIGNYYHAFDTQTVTTFTGPLFDETTLFICDEAHMLESSVRDLASDRIALTTLERARNEIAQVIEFAKGREGRGSQAVAEAALDEAGVARADLSLMHTFIGAIIDTVEHIAEEQAAYAETVVPLRDPEVVEEDALTATLAESGYNEAAWRAGEQLAPVVERVLNAVDGEERWRAAPTVSRFLSTWWAVDHEAYFRTIVLEARERAHDRPSWRAGSRGYLQLSNCLPGDVIAAVLQRFGGGVLMSATLEPMDVFTEVVGLDRLERAGRPVRSVRYGLPFPEEHRMSLIVDTPKFTHQNRGPPDTQTPTRELYADVISTIARSPGNVLVGMPSYAEARWAATELEARIDRPVLLDQSSDRATTDELKAEFFAGPPKVLVTSLRGTLTEGVDYEGDRLAAAVVCGVPIINMSDPTTKAMQTAYERRFGNGFEQALVVPAVRKARQALGRVIRGVDEVGVRVLVDERYLHTGWDGVRHHLPEGDEFEPISPEYLEGALERFWEAHRGNT